MKMKFFAVATVLFGMQFFSNVARANGYGAIACDNNGSGACTAVSDYSNLNDAETAAINLCQRSGDSCYIYNWEYWTCIYGPNGSYACN